MTTEQNELLEELIFAAKQLGREEMAYRIGNGTMQALGQAENDLFEAQKAFEKSFE